MADRDPPASPEGRGNGGYTPASVRIRVHNMRGIECRIAKKGVTEKEKETVVLLTFVFSRNVHFCQ